MANKEFYSLRIIKKSALQNCKKNFDSFSAQMLIMYTSQLLNAFNLFQDDIKNSDDIPARFEIFLKFCYKYADKHYLHKFKKNGEDEFRYRKRP